MTKLKANQEIRSALKESGMKHWELAAAIGVDETTLCRWLRKELPDDKKSDILHIIKSGERHDER